MKAFCHQALSTLAFSRGKKWADEYVKLRMEFHRRHGHGLIMSTWHGLDFFDNLLKAIETNEICDEPKGEYRNNFLKLVSIGQKEA